MKKIFDPDALVWRAMAFIGDLILLNLVFILTSIPIITIGTSITALASVQFRVIEKRTDFVVKDYFRAWKSNFKNSTIIWMIYLAFILSCILNMNVIINVSPSGKKIFLILMGCGVFLVTMTVMYSLAMQARFVNTLSDTVVKGFLIGLSGLPYTIVIILMYTACVGVTVQTIGTILYGLPVWILIGFSGLAYLSNLMFLRVFKKVTRKTDLPDEDLLVLTEREVYHDGDRKRDAKRRMKERKRAGKE